MSPYSTAVDGTRPRGWDVKRLKYCVSLINEAPESSDLPYVGLEHIESWTGRQLPSESAGASEGQASCFRPGDVLFGKLRPYLAKVLRAREPGMCSGELLVLRPRILTQEFLYYCVLSRAFIDQVDSSTYGAKMPRANWDFIGSLPVLIPPGEEQRAIAAFLDHETARIDALIGKKLRQIELLQEKHAVVISHAVTRGLNSKVKLKNSGLDWLGPIPEHWQVKRLKYLTPQVTVGIVVTPSKFYVDEGIPCLRSLNVREGRLTDCDLVFISAESNELHAKSKLREGDVVAVRSGQPGTTAVVDKRFDGANCIDLIIIRQSPRFDSTYLSYAMGSQYVQGQFSAGSGGAIQQHFNIETANNLLIALPPRPEQIAIREFLDGEVGRLATLQERVQASVAKLQEYRSALISAAVTGKLKIREEVAA